MNDAGARRGAGTRGSAAIASLFVLLAGFGVAAYCIAFRTAGVQAASGNRELGIVAAAVIALAILARFATASALRRAGGGPVHRLLGRALEVDATDPDALREFASVPPLRDLVASWIAERAQTRELGDRVESLRGELDGIADAMRLSSQDLGRIREQPQSPLGVQIVATWNTLVERLKQAEAKAASAVAAASPVAAAAPEVRTLVARLDELESELERLRGDVQEPPALEILGTEPEPQPPPQRRPLGAAAAVPQRRMDADDAWGEVEIVEPLPATAAWHVVDEPQDTRAQFGIEPAAAPEPARAPAAAPAPHVAPAGLPRFEDLDFPHFVGKPVQPLHDRVAVTYEGQDAAAEAAELPAGSLLFDDDLPPLDAEPPVFDRRRSTRPERGR